MDDRFRTSDADRDRVAALLRDHFAAGRLTPDELDERLTAALTARTFGALRHALSDLPGPVPVLRPASRFPPQVAPLRMPGRRRPRILPLMALALVAVLLIPGAGWIFLAFFQAVLLLWLVTCLTGVFLAARLHRRMRHRWRSGQDHFAHQDWPAGYAHR